METLEDHTILYDEDCPMCRLYTGTFVRTKMLDKDGRVAYQRMPENLQCLVDRQRAVNEIALVNRKTGKVEYGVRSLFLILQNRFPMLKSLFHSDLFFFLADKAYKFISYNRRVIVPSGSYKQSRVFDEPAMHRGYRFTYLFVAWLLTALILFGYSSRLAPLLPGSNVYREFLVCGGQILWQWVFVHLIDRRKSLDYLGNLMTISLAGAFLLLLVQGVAGVIGITHAYFYLAAFLGIVALMFAEHIRRTRLLRLGWVLIITWVAYRILVLLILL